MTHQSIEYEEIIRAAGYRVTPQRTLILDAVCQGSGHTSLGEIYARTRALDPGINRSTVYRALDLFVRLGLAVSAEIGGETFYEIARPRPHHHLVCERCGGITEISHDAVRGLAEIVEREQGFKVRQDHLVIRGLCAKCREE